MPGSPTSAVDDPGSSHSDESSCTQDELSEKHSSGCSADCHKHAHDGCQHGKEAMVKRMAEALRRTRLAENDKTGPRKPEPATSSTAAAYLCKHNIMKRTLNAGVGLQRMPPECLAAGGGISYPAETKFIFNYRIRDPDEPDVFLDDTKRYGKTMELYSGKDFQIEVS